MSDHPAGAKRSSDRFEKGQNKSCSSPPKIPSSVYPCWWDSDSKVSVNSKLVSGNHNSGNQVKYFGNTSTEFQSLKLESVSSTMEELKLVSVNFSKMLEQEQRYKEKLSSSKDHTDSASLSSDDDATPEHFLSHQTSVFDQMREFLLAQQMCLKQNLEMLHTNTLFQRGELTHCSPEERPTDDTGDMNHNEELEALRQWGSSSAGKTNEIQICPVCGMEFEVSENPDALEEHVASHWSSSEPM